MKYRHCVTILLLLTGACSDTTAPSDPVVGTWTLQSWNAKPLPAITYGVASASHQQLVSEELVVDRNGTFTLRRTERFMPQGSVETRSGAGAWKTTAVGYAIGGGFVPATMSSGNLIVQWSGDGATDWVYRRAGG